MMFRFVVLGVLASVLGADGMAPQGSEGGNRFPVSVDRNQDDCPLACADFEGLNYRLDVSDP